MEGSRIVLDLDALMRESQVSVRGLGVVQLDPDTPVVRAEVGRHVRRPFGLDYRAFANRVLGLSMASPQPAAVVDALPEADRRRLMARVAKLARQSKSWRALHGGVLSWDERFFAVMVWAWRRDRNRHAEARRSIAELEQTLKGPASITAAMTKLSPWASLGLTKNLDAATGVSKLMQAAMGPSFAKPWFLDDKYGRLTNAATPLGVEGRVRGPAVSAMVGPALRGYDATAFNPTFLKTITQAQQVSKSVEQLHVRPGLAATAYMSTAAGLKGRTAQTEVARMLDRATGISRSWGPLSSMYATPGGLLGTPKLIEQLTRGVLGPNFALPGGFDPGRWWIDPLAPWVFPEPNPFEERFYSQWESDPLWFFIGELGIVAIRPFFTLPREAFLGLVLDAVENAICAGKLIAWLRAEVARAPYLNDDQRHTLDRGLAEAAANEWTIASVLLLVGLEGAISMTPVAQQTIAASRKFIAAEKLIKAIGLDDSENLFLRRGVYGDGGNKVRHGRDGADHRRQCLLAIVGLAAWLDAHAKTGAMEAIAATVSRGLKRG
jgi:hypothetical protein